MRNKIKTILLFIALFITNIAICQESEWGKYASLMTPMSTYTIYKTDSEIIIDGRDKETDWAKTESLSDFGDIRGIEWPKPFLNTDVKILWDNQNLYVFARLEEPDLRGEMTQRDDLLYNENNFEIFIDPDGDTHNYFEIEVNVLNTIFDLFMTKSYRDAGMALFTWDSPGFQSAIKANGTINNSSDTDNGWTVEMKIPFATLRKADLTKIPRDKDIWKVNLMRIEWEGGNAADKKNNPDGVKTNYWTWSPQGLISMHYPERWGLMQFSENLVGHEKVVFEAPISEYLKKYLWLVYYKQKDFQRKHGRYALSLDEITMPEKVETDKLDATIKLIATKKQFTVELICDNEIISLNETAFLTKKTRK